jgi:hypothetical protein
MSTLAQRSFAGGEISPSLYARVDTIKYQTGLRQCRNFFVQRDGGLSNRPGTEFTAKIHGTDPVRLIPFQFNDDQTYVLVFSHLRLKIVHFGDELVATSFTTVTGISKALPATVTTSGAHGLVAGDEVFISGVVGMTEINNRSFQVGSVTTTTFTLWDGAQGLDTNTYSTYTSGGKLDKTLFITTPYAFSDLANLQFVQSADVVTIVHPSYAPQELKRLSSTSWTLTPVAFNPTISAPSGLSATAGGAGSKTYRYRVSSIAQTTSEESLPTSVFTLSSAAPPTAAAPVTITWTLLTGASEYNVYKETNGIYGLLGVAGSNTFSDIGQDIDTSVTAPNANNPFSGAGDYPGTVAYIQQRLMFASTNNNPETVWGSRTGNFHNFTTSTPIQDDDSIQFTMAGRQVNQVRHLLDLTQLVIFSSAGEWVVAGDTDGTIKPTAINPKQNSYNGSSGLNPIVIGADALYVQARGTIVRDLAFDYQIDGYRGNDLSIFASHLFDGYSIVDWCYQQIPHSIVWCVRSDGILLGLTYIKEHQIWAWHRHDFGDDTVERVCSVPEGDEDAVYVVVKRTINGVPKRYLERLSSRQVTDIRNFTGMDSHLTYDGTNQNTTQNMTLTGGTSWSHTETLTLTTNSFLGALTFSPSDVGNAIQLTDLSDPDSKPLRFTITQYISSTVVKGKAHKTVPPGLQGNYTYKWAKAVDQVTGLWHLEGQEVSVLADGFVVSSPLNGSYQTLTVINGTINLGRPYAIIHVGLPFVSDLETLDVDTAQGETLSDKKKRVGRLTIHLQSSRGIFAGSKPPVDSSADPLEGLFELKMRHDETYEDPIALLTGTAELTIQPSWTTGGRVFVRQVDPLPLSVLAICGDGQFPFRQSP